ncbi:MAG: MATE family efflux transporter [Candidatus Heteroscillospira sp.]|jgi:putative MATE family efflux protein
MENDLGHDGIGRLVWRIGVPSMLAQFISVLYNIVDRIFVGNIPQVGDTALAGVGVCGPIVTMIGSVAFLVGMGGAPLMSIRMGEGRMAGAEKIVSNCFLMLCLLSVAITAAVLPLRGSMLRLFGASGSTYPYAEAYFSIYVGGTVFALLSTGMNQFIIAQGFARAGMYAVVIGAVMNIILDPILIFKFDMGVRGAALATIISQAASAAYVLLFLFGRRAPVRIRFMVPDKREMIRVLSLGFTPFTIIALDNVMIISMNALLQRYGGPEHGDALVTCNTIVQSFMLVLAMPMGGISGGTQSILSYNYGACRSDRVISAQKYIAVFCVLYASVMFVLARVAGETFCAMFTSDVEIRSMAVRAIDICTLAIIPLGMQYALVDGLTAMGQMQLSLPLSLWRKFCYFVSLFILPAVFGAGKTFYAEPISDVLGPIVTAFVYLRVIRKILKRREQEAENERIADIKCGGKNDKQRLEK